MSDAQIVASMEAVKMSGMDMLTASVSRQLEPKTTRMGDISRFGLAHLAITGAVSTSLRTTPMDDVAKPEQETAPSRELSR